MDQQLHLQGKPYNKPKSITRNKKILHLLVVGITGQSFTAVVGWVFSSLYSSVTGCFMDWWWMWACYIVVCLFGTLTHWAGHKHWSGRWFRAHTMEHHVKLYPSNRFMNPNSIGAEDANAKYYAPTILFPFISTYIMYNSVFASLFVGLYNGLLMHIVDVIHQEYHTIGSPLDHYAIFQSLRDVHYNHHRGDMLKNFGVTDLIMDVLLGNLAVC